MEALPHSGRASFPIEDLATDRRLGPIALAKGLGGGRMSGKGAARGTSTQDFLARGWEIAMDSEVLALPFFEAGS